MNFYKNNLIELDGSVFEGGGQILRTSLALSVLTKKPFIIRDIRKNRPEKGLKQQHLTAVNVIKDLCNAEVKGNELKSENLEFYPMEVKYNNLNIDIGTAGSITLLLQALMPVLIFSDKPIKVRIKGGTDVKHSPAIDYFTHVFLPFLKNFIYYETELLKRGYYPKGNGDFIIKLKPKYSLKNFNSFSEFHKFLLDEKKAIQPEKNELLLIKGISHASKELMKNSVAERQAKFAKYVLKNYLIEKKIENVDVKIQIEYNDSLSIGSGITLWAVYNKTNKNNNSSSQSLIDKSLLLGNADELKIGTIIGSDNLGEKGKKAELVGKECALNLINQMKNNYDVDSFMSDQLLIYLALFGGKIKGEITEHCKANIYVIEKFLDKTFFLDGYNIIIENKQK